MNLAGLIQGMGSPIDDASRQARSFSDLQALYDRQAAAETARQQRMRQETYRQGLTQPVESPEDLPGGVPAPRAGIPTAPAAQPAAPAAPMSFATGSGRGDMIPPPVGMPQPVYPPANVPLNRPYQDVAGYTPPAGMSGPEQLRQLQAERLRRFQNPQQAAAESAATSAQRAGRQPAPFDASTGFPQEPTVAAPAQAAPTQAAAPTPVAPRAAQYDAKQTPFDDLMTQAAQQNGLDPVVFKRLIGSESSFNPQAVSPSGRNAGLGIAQINAVHGMSDEDRLNPQVAIPFAAQLFAQYLREANGDYAEAMMRYKGASSERGRAAMQTPIAEVLSGTQFGAGAQAPAAQATQTAGATAAPGAPAMQFGPEQVTRISTAVQQDLRVKQLQLAEINRLLQMAPDVQTATQLREQANNIRFGAFQSQLVNASAQALGGDENAVAQLANAARVQYAQTDEGYVAVQQGPDGQFRATSQPMDREQFINALFSEASGKAQRQRDTQAEAMAKARADIVVEEVKGRNAMLARSADAQAALQKLIVETQLKADDVKGVEFDPIRGSAFMRTNRGVYTLQPAQDLGGGILSEPRWVLVQQ